MKTQADDFSKRNQYQLVNHFFRNCWFYYWF